MRYVSTVDQYSGHYVVVATVVPVTAIVMTKNEFLWNLQPVKAAGNSQNETRAYYRARTISICLSSMKRVNWIW